MAAVTREVTIDFKDILNAGWTNASLRIALLTTVAVDDGSVHPTEHIHVVTDETGAGSVDLAVPATGAWNYKMSLPDGNAYVVPIGAGTAVTLASLLAAAFPPADNPTLDEYYLRTDGSNAMTGELLLPGDPTVDLSAVPRQYADFLQSLCVPKTAEILTLTADHILIAGNAGSILECDGTFTLTAPDGLAAGFQVAIANVGTGVITVAATTTLQSKSSAVTLANQYGMATLYHRGSNVWLLAGDLS